jgi:hypothetical protein
MNGVHDAILCVFGLGLEPRALRYFVARYIARLFIDTVINAREAIRADKCVRNCGACVGLERDGRASLNILDSLIVRDGCYSKQFSARREQLVC